MAYIHLALTVILMAIILILLDTYEDEFKRRRKTLESTIDIEKTGQYFTVFVEGEFYCTADTIEEANREVEEYIRKKERGKRI